MADGPRPKEAAPPVDQALEDFNRIQLQFNEVKMEKLQLEDEVKRQHAAAEASQRMYVDADKALKKVERVIGKSKKHKETRSALEKQDEELSQLQIQNEGLLQNLAELGTLNEQLERAARKKGVDPTLEPRLKELNEKLAKRADTEAALNAEVARLKEEALVAERRYADSIARRLSSPTMSPGGGGGGVEGEPDLAEINEEDLDASADGGATDGTADLGAALDGKMAAAKLGTQNCGSSSLESKYRKLKTTCAELRGLSTRAEERVKGGLDKIKSLEDELAKAKTESRQLAAQLLTDDIGESGGEEIEILTEKLKKKQKAFLNLQTDAEKVYAEAELLRARVAKLESREASKAASAEAVEAVEALQSKLDKTLVELGVQTDLAEKRKETLNTQANETQERIASETAKYAALNVKAEAEAVELRTQITTLKEQLSTAQGAAEANVGGAKQAKDLQAAKEWLERRVDELQSEMAIKVAELEGELAAQTARATEAAERVDLAASEHTAALAAKQAELTAVHDQVNEASGDRNLAEKKTAALLKDLKKQLKLEQRKSKKMEDALAAGESTGGGARSSPALTASSRAISVASLKSFGGSQESLASTRSSYAPRGSSVGTPSGGTATSRGEVAREPIASPQLSSDEHTQIMMRMTAMQTDNAELEDQLRFLRGKVRELQGELAQKSEVIMQYATRGASKGSTPTSSRKFIGKGSRSAKKGNDNKADHGVQTVLEETLMKNIQLQNMVELLQKEISASGDSGGSGKRRVADTEPATPTKPTSEITSM